MTAKSKAKMMRRLRDEREAKGLKRREYWATVEQHKDLKAYLEQLNKGN